MALRNAFENVSTETKQQEQIDTLIELVKQLMTLSNKSDNFFPDSAGRNRVNIEAGTLPTVTTVTTVNTVTTVTTVNNVANIGGFSAAYDQYSQMLIGASMIRNQIIVT